MILLPNIEKCQRLREVYGARRLGGVENADYLETLLARESDPAVRHALKLSIRESRRQCAANVVGYASANLSTERARMGRQFALWGRGGNGFPWESVRENNSLGDVFYENFLTWAQQTITTTPAVGTYVGGNGTPWKSSEGTTTLGSIIQNAADIPVGVTGSLIPPAVGLCNGAVRLSTNAGTTAHNECAMEPGGLLAAKGNFGLPSSAAVNVPIPGQLPKVYFEARVRFAQTTLMAMFLGLAAPTNAGHNTMFSGADVAQKISAIGFWINPVSDGLTPHQWAISAAQIQPGYAVTAAGATISNAATATFVGNVGGIPSTTDYPGNSAATAYNGQTVTPTPLLTDFTKLGFVLDPTDPAGLALRFYQDGVQIAAQTISQLVAANWPSNVPLNPLVYIQSTGAGTTAQVLSMDWIIAATQLAVE